MNTLVETTAGRVQGYESQGLAIFKGVPFAAPPVGARRWLAPEPHPGWEGVRDASSFGCAPYQNVVPEAAEVLPGMNIAEHLDEDCLVLNVWTPGLDGARRPVMVWIHGGGFTIGAGSQDIYDGTTLARRGDVVVVTVNYRLGPLGFVNLDGVTGGAIPASGNEGLLDQVEALKWVRDNIERFGGDPGNVTIFGESAGGMSVGSLLGLPAAKGLFHKAIPQSGACHTANTPEAISDFSSRFVEALGSAEAGGLRAVTPTRLLETATAVTPPPGTAGRSMMPFQPCIDGAVLPTRPIEAVAAGSAAGVPILVGSILEEWKLFAAMDPSTFSIDEEGLLARAAASMLEANGAAVVAAYRSARDARGDSITAPDIFAAIETDRVFRMPAVRLAETQLRHTPDVYSYIVTWASPAAGGILGACHAIELPFVFGTINNKGMDEFIGTGPAVEALATRMQDAWIAFARTGNPSCESLGEWPAYNTTTRPTMMLGRECAAGNAPYDRERAAWDGAPESVLGRL